MRSSLQTKILGAKLDAGGANYDLVQPTDYFVSVLVRKGQLQKLDKSKLTILKNLDPHYMDLPFDPGNEYTLPYQAGTDAIVVNTDGCGKCARVLGGSVEA